MNNEFFIYTGITATLAVILIIINITAKDNAGKRLMITTGLVVIMIAVAGMMITARKYLDESRLNYEKMKREFQALSTRPIIER